MISHGTYNNSLESLIERIPEADIASYYLPDLVEIPEVISSPLRKDEHPSFRIFSPDGVKVRFYDYATKEQGGIIDLVMRMFGLSFQGALEKIDKDIVKSRTKNINPRTAKGKLVIKADHSEYSIRTKMRKWESWDFEYWNSYGVPEKWLKAADIYPISHIFIVSETGYIKTVVADKYAYTFIERKDGIITEKVYQPYNKDGFKWRSGHDASVWDLWTKLPGNGEIVIITSSRKDALCIWAQTGIPSVSLQGEGMRIKPQVMQELKDRFKKVFVLYDNDSHKEINNGRIDGKKIADEFGVIQIEIPDSYECKDTSDLYHQYGGDTVRKAITELIKE